MRFAYLSQLSSKGNLKVLVRNPSFLFHANCLSISEAGRQHLILDFFEDSLGPFERKRFCFDLPDVSEVVDQEIGDSQGSSGHQVLPNVFVLRFHLLILNIQSQLKLTHIIEKTSFMSLIYRSFNQIQMLENSLYHPSELSSIKKGLPPHLAILNNIQSFTSERSLLTSIFHMMLGLSSDIFTINNHRFSVSQFNPQLQHLSQQVLRLELQRLVEMGNNMQLIRNKGNTLKNSGQKMLQAFGMGLSDIQKKI